jgi:DNA polymerase
MLCCMTAVRTRRPGADQWVPNTDDLDELRAAAPACRGCELWEPATQVVFSAGAAGVPIAMVGEQPGDHEDRQGVPFVGPAGRMLDDALADAGIDRSTTYVSNAVKHFRFKTVGKRRIHQAPELGQMIACKPWLDAELRIVDPQLVVLLGATAAKSLLGKDFRVTQHRGKVIPADGDTPPWDYLPTVHPSSILRLRGEERAGAYEALVDDLRVAADHLRG